MARTASGHQLLEKAKELLSNARTAKEVRQAQAVILPLEFKMSLEQTSAITGISKTGSVGYALSLFMLTETLNVKSHMAAVVARICHELKSPYFWSHSLRKLELAAY